MIYLKNFKLLDKQEEFNIISSLQNTNFFNSYYPLHIFTTKRLKNITFDDITIFCGGNGSGKTTLINIISNKLNASKKSNTKKVNYLKHTQKQQNMK